MEFLENQKQMEPVGDDAELNEAFEDDERPHPPQIKKSKKNQIGFHVRNKGYHTQEFREAMREEMRRKQKATEAMYEMTKGKDETIKRLKGLKLYKGEG
nr:hypothetical protein [Tanacetum cinerariifolium]